MEQAAAETGDSPPTTDLVEELATLARARTRLAVDLAYLPVLGSLTRGDAVDLDAVQALVDRARKRLPSREAEAIEVLLADTDERWTRNLRERMTLAGSLVGVGSYHTFRDRKRPEGRSLYDQLLERLADAIIDETAPPAEVAPADDIELIPDPEPEIIGDAPDEPSGASVATGTVDRRRSVLAVAFAALLGLVGAWFVLRPDDAVGNTVVYGDTEMSFGSRIEGCDIPLGGTMNPAGVPEYLVTSMLAAVEEAGEIEAVGCPLHTVKPHFDGELMIQQFSGGSLPAGSIVAVAETEEAFWFEQSLVDSMLRTNDGNLFGVDGHPIGNDDWQGHPTMWLEQGAIVAHQAGGPAFWTPGPAVELWEELGGPSGVLGLSMTDVNYIDGVPRQDFAGGILRQGSDTLVVEELFDEATIDADLEAAGDLRGKIVRTIHSTAWYIDADGVRHWLPDSATWSCYGGEANAATERVGGWVIGRFEAGEPASC